MSTPSAEVFSRALRVQRRPALIWSGTLVLLTLMTISVWPSFQDSPALTEFSDSLPPEMAAAFGMQDLGSPAGYLMGNLYSLLLPLLLGAMGIAIVAALTTNDEESGRLELLMALPVSRKAVFTARFLAVVTVVVVVSVLVWATVIGSRGAVDLDVSAGGVTAISAMLTLFALFHVGLVYALAGIGVKRAAALAVGVGVLVAGYVMDAILPLAEALEPAQSLSPWNWALGADPLRDGFDPVGALVLLVLTLVLFAVGTVGIGRRDLRSP